MRVVLISPSQVVLEVFPLGLGRTRADPCVPTEAGRTACRNLVSVLSYFMPESHDALNVASNSSEVIGKKLSNFAERRFVLDGKHYRSVEGWYQGLKWPEKNKRAEIAKLAGPSAKRVGKGAPNVDCFIYEGKEFKFGSPGHHGLVKAAVRASLRSES